MVIRPFREQYFSLIRERRRRGNHGCPATVVAFVSAAALFACGADESSGSALESPDFDFGGRADAGQGGAPSDNDFGEDSGFVPEPEQQDKRVPPAASQRFVYVAVPAAGFVARIDSVTLAVTPIPVGENPTTVLAVSGSDTAIVLNRASDSVSVIESSVEGAQVTDLKILEACNELVLDPTGRFAVAWFSNRAAETGDRIGSLQEVSLLNLQSLQVFTITVGFNVRGATFANDGERLLVVSDSGVSVISTSAVTADQYVPPTSLGDDPLADVTDREVVASPSAQWVLARNSSEPGVRVLNIETSALAFFELPAIPTDVDILEEQGVALVAVRDASALALVDLNGEGSGAVQLLDTTPAPAGVATPLPDGSAALLHTGDPSRTDVGLIELPEGDILDIFTLRKSIFAVYPAPNGRRALVLHPVEAPVDGASGLGARVRSTNAMSLVDLESGYAKLMLLNSAPDDVLFTPESDAVFVLNNADGVQGTLHWLNLNTFSQTTYTFPLRPDAMGWVAEGRRLFVVQDDAAGRLTFIDADDGAVFEVSSFALNGLVE
jgi:DNA-binding beta-propeller fold protein YncE